MRRRQPSAITPVKAGAHGCGAAGAIYDLASVLHGGPTGRWLRGDDFCRARGVVQRAFGGI